MKYLKYFLYLVIAAGLFFFAKGFFTPSVYHESEIIVDKSAKEAWAVMSDEANLPKWIEGYKRNELVSGTANTVGAISKIYIEEGGKEMVMEEKITAVTPNELMAMRFSMDFMDMDYVMTFKENDGKTIINTKTTTFGNGIFAKSMVSFMTSAMKTQEDKNLAKLKELINNNTKNYFPTKEESITEVSIN